MGWLKGGGVGKVDDCRDGRDVIEFVPREKHMFSSNYSQIFTSEHAVGEHLIVDFLSEHSRFLYCTQVHSCQISIQNIRGTK